MRRPTSITARLILSLLAGLAVVWLAGAGAAVLIVRGQLEQTLDGGLRETAERILPLVVDTLEDRDEVEGYREGTIDPEGGEYVVYQARRSDGSVVMRSHDAPEAPFAAPLDEGFASVAPWRIFTTGDTRTGLHLQVAEDEARRNEATWQSAAAMALPLLLLIPVAAAIISLSVRRGLAPLRDLGRDVSARDAGNLAPLPERAAPTELSPIRSAINGLLARLRSAFEAERAFAANSAHELRTPIAGSLAQTQRLVEELDGHPAQARARRVEETLVRLATLAAKLLALSRAEAGTARLAEPVDLKPSLELMVRDAQREHGARLTLAMAPVARLVAPMDIDAFGIALRNLIENAERHGTAGGPIAIAVGDNWLEVTNGAATIPAERLAQLGRRFERGDTGAPGSGLGLAIVDNLVRQVGGQLELSSPASGRADGFTARIRLPEV